MWCIIHVYKKNGEYCLMMRFIPRKVKVKITLFKNFTIFDCVLILIGLAGTIALITTNIFDTFMNNVYLGLFFGGLWCTLLLERSDGIKLCMV